MNQTLIKNIISKKEVQTILTDLYNSDIRKEGRHVQTYNLYTRDYHCFSKGDLESTWSVAERLKPMMESLSGNRCVVTRTYTRINKENSVLHIHTDRPPLDLTFSVCLKKDIDWELYISNRRANEEKYPRAYFKEDYNKYEAEVGDGIFCRGRVYPHWRKPYSGIGDQENIYTFIHYKIV